MRTPSLYKRTWPRFSKTIASILIVCFTSLQILPPAWSQSISLEAELQNQIPEKPVPEIAPPQEPLAGIPFNTFDFLSSGDQSPLSPATPVPSETKSVHDYDRYDFED